MHASPSGQMLRVPLYIDAATDKRDLILAETTSAFDVFVARSIPAFAWGLAYGDTFRIVDAVEGHFALLQRSGDITMRAYIRGTLDRPEVHALRDALGRAGGRHEIALDHAPGCMEHSLLLLSVGVAFGFPAIEALLGTLPASDCEWEYGNVYGRDGQPLNWWEDQLA